MRFVANGPFIPDELLLARDQGRVVFFCGAGVSRAKAGLPDFFGLAEKVTDKLGIPTDSSVMKILAEARAIGGRTGVDGLISADRIFGLLERQFSVRDIDAAVAAALEPPQNADLSAHKTLLRLATTREGLLRLVTTNFDRLFDACDPKLVTFQPPKLPDPSRPSEINGVVYLHGKATLNYDGAERDGFVLSSSEFGRAYLSDGWATRFFRQIIEKYFVVFVGYTADDPPVQYLLEALNKTAGRLEGAYAFQSGDANYALSKWQHKGVEAIPYENSDNHKALWDTLNAWAERATDPDGWVERIVNEAKAGPEDLAPHLRGQVAHVVSTLEGVRRFSEAVTPPPATWLCVFDPLRRYAKPGHIYRSNEKGPYVDPFNLYGIDSDSVPNAIDPDADLESREVPQAAWSAFNLNKLDLLSLREENISSLRGHWAANIPRLPKRLEQLAVWIRRVAHQPAAVWWAARQNALHPRLGELILWELGRPEFTGDPVVRTAWKYLLEYWSRQVDSWQDTHHEIASEISKSGWNDNTVRRYAEFIRPRLKVETEFWSSPTPPTTIGDSLGDLVRLDVEYPDLPANIKVPDEALRVVVVQLRRNLEIATELEREVGGYGLRSISPITPDDDPNVEHYGRDRGLSAFVLHFAKQFERLVNLDSGAALGELNFWPIQDGSVFSRLAIWAASNDKVVSAERFISIIGSISNDVFWDEYQARDLLLTTKTRWVDLDQGARQLIEERITRGPPRFDHEAEEAFIERGAWSILNRVHWLRDQGLDLSIDIDALTKKLGNNAPRWKPEYAAGATSSLEGRSGWVRTETDHSALLAEPIASTLAKAMELSGRKGVDFVDYDPFAGLANENPIRAISVLRRAARTSEYPEWAWRTFLNRERRKDDKPRLVAFIAHQIIRFPSDATVELIRPVAEWCHSSAEMLSSASPALFSRLFDKLADALALEPTKSRSSIVRGNKEPDWTMEAINSPTGDLAQALFDDPRKKGLVAKGGFPPSWLMHAEKLLALPGDLRRHAIVIFCHNLSWFFAIDPLWTKRNLITILERSDKEDIQAFWGGFLWGSKLHGHELFVLLKPHMIEVIRSNTLERRGHAENLTAMILSAWALVDEATGTKWVTDNEFRQILAESKDSIRTRVLWQAERWAHEPREEGSADWPKLIIELLSNVWPRQLSAKSAVVSARLCDLAFSMEEKFLEVSEVILPLLTKAKADRINLPHLRKSNDNIVDLYPERTLEMLYLVLPNEANAWPYGIESTLGRIGQANPLLNSDERLLELRRIWNSR